MIVLDGTIVTVALPSISADLGFSGTTLVWVVNAFLLTYAGFRLLSGRVGDVFGHRRLLLLGIMLFTLASLGCAMARSQVQLIGARALQGLGGAAVGAAAFSLVVNLFRERSDRAKAIGIYGFVSTGGGAAGLLLGGVLTTALNWHWIFLINLPIGTAVLAFSYVLLPDTRRRKADGSPDIAGAVAVITSIMLCVYAIVGSDEAGWISVRTFAIFLSAAVLLILFVAIEARARIPLVPLDIFQERNLTVCAIAGALTATVGSAGVFTSLYLQLVLRCSPLQVSLFFLPSTLIVAVFSLGLSAKLVLRFGIKWLVVGGLLVAASGDILLAQAPVSGDLASSVIPGTLLWGLGVAIAGNSTLLAAMRGVAPTQSGLISGIVTTSSMMGGIVGLAVLASVAAARTNVLLAWGVDLPHALNSGYHIAFCIGAACAAAAATIGAGFLPTDLQILAYEQVESGAAGHR
jgi:MFS family permease